MNKAHIFIHGACIANTCNSRYTHARTHTHTHTHTISILPHPPFFLTLHSYKWQCGPDTYTVTKCGGKNTTDVTECKLCQNTVASCKQDEYLSARCDGTGSKDTSVCSACAHKR